MEKVFVSNQEFWKKESQRVDSNGILLYENFYNELQLQYGVSKVALCIAKSLNLTPAVLLPWRDAPMSKSMCETQFQIKNHIPIIVLKHLIEIIMILLFVNKKKILKLKKGDDLIGESIYDACLRKFCLNTMETIGFKQRLNIILELCYYYYFQDILDSYPIKTVVLGDCVYRFGLLYEMCKNRGITCYSPINLNSVFISKFVEKEDYKSNYLNKELLDKLCEGCDYTTLVNDYFTKRYSGNIEQHDVLSAYANKKISSSEEFIKKYNLDPQKKTVIIMSHVFADAPHVYTDSLYDDYWEWFVNTYRCLINNPKINLLVKEHPSAHLYGQKGLVNDFLDKEGKPEIQIKDDESTLSILQNVDAVVTCGGTIGLEISYFGKNVILASKPPYSGLGFSKDFDDRKSYEDYLCNEVQNIEKLTNEQKVQAIKASYVLFYLENSWSASLELGGDIIYMGKKYDDSALFNNIIGYNEIELKNQNVYKLLDGFVRSEYKQLYNLK